MLPCNGQKDLKGLNCVFQVTRKLTNYSKSVEEIIKNRAEINGVENRKTIASS